MSTTATKERVEMLWTWNRVDGTSWGAAIYGPVSEVEALNVQPGQVIVVHRKNGTESKQIVSEVWRVWQKKDSDYGTLRVRVRQLSRDGSENEATWNAIGRLEIAMGKYEKEGLEVSSCTLRSLSENRERAMRTMANAQTLGEDISGLQNALDALDERYRKLTHKLHVNPSIAKAIYPALAQ